MLLEVIRLSPAMPHPYHTLGLIYEELLQPSRAIKLFLMAAQLQKRDAQQWRHVATLAGAGERSFVVAARRVLKDSPPCLLVIDEAALDEALIEVAKLDGSADAEVETAATNMSALLMREGASPQVRDAWVVALAELERRDEKRRQSALVAEGAGVGLAVTIGTGVLVAGACCVQ